MIRFFVIVSFLALVGCSSDPVDPVKIMRMKDSNAPYKGFVLDEIYKYPDGTALVIFETCAGNIWQLSTGDLTYEGDFPSVECVSLAHRGGHIE